MKNINKLEFQSILKKIESAYDKEFSEEKADLYFDNLKDFDLDVIRLACREMVRTRELKSIPTIGEIRKEASFIRNERRSRQNKSVYCKHCSGTGWIIVEEKDGMKYSTAYRCDCKNGQSISKDSMSYKEAMIKYGLPPLNQPEPSYPIITAEDIIADPGKVYSGVRVELICKNCHKIYYVPYHSRVTGREIMECYMGAENFRKLIEEGYAEHLGGDNLCELCYEDEGRKKGFWI
ncbi:MAG TPA: hypothetical protein ENN23_02890 [Deltaproteobacteria bacterium]|nr:hypothetical protein [Deltaproteobacteria bacterium]